MALGRDRYRCPHGIRPESPPRPVRPTSHPRLASGPRRCGYPLPDTAAPAEDNRPGCVGGRADVSSKKFLKGATRSRRNATRLPGLKAHTQRGHAGPSERDEDSQDRTHTSIWVPPPAEGLAHEQTRPTGPPTSVVEGHPRPAQRSTSKVDVFPFLRRVPRPRTRTTLATVDVKDLHGWRFCGSGPNPGLSSGPPFLTLGDGSDTPGYPLGRTPRPGGTGDVSEFRGPLYSDHK